MDEVVVAADDRRRVFQYWHIAPDVAVGDRVEAQRTELGRVQAPAMHVHLTEILDGVVQNPLQPHHLTPYSDSTVPAVGGLYLLGASGRELSPTAVSGTIDLVASAHDLPAMPVPAPWNDLPVSPAWIAFEVTTPDGREVLPEQATADFAVTEPPNREFFSSTRPARSRTSRRSGTTCIAERPATTSTS